MAFLVIASFILRYNGRASWRVGLRDRKNHTSPNCAYPEGAVAGALGITLGGTHEYFGETVVKPTIGSGTKPVSEKEISQNDSFAIHDFNNRFFHVCKYLPTIILKEWQDELY